MTSPQRLLTWDVYTGELLPKLLTDAGLPATEAAAIAADVARRAGGYAASGRAARRALRAPFLDDVAQFEPAEAPIGVKATAAVVVRNCAGFEHAHAHGPLGDRELAMATTLAAGALSTWLSEQPAVSEDAPPAGGFAPVSDYPRAARGLQALALAAEDGQRQEFRVPDAPVPALPPVTAESRPTADGSSWTRSATAGADQRLVDQLTAIVEGREEVLVVSSMSRLSRDSVLLAHVLEVILAAGGQVLTTNMLLRSGDAYARRGAFLPANSRDHRVGLSTERLRGAHGKLVAEVAAQFNE